MKKMLFGIELTIFSLYFTRSNTEMYYVGFGLAVIGLIYTAYGYSQEK